MRRLLSGLATVALIAGIAPRAAEAQSLQEALRNALDEGCRASASGAGLLSAGEFAAPVQRTEPGARPTQLSYQVTAAGTPITPVDDWRFIPQGTIQDFLAASPAFEQARIPQADSNTDGIIDERDQTFPNDPLAFDANGNPVIAYVLPGGEQETINGNTFFGPRFRVPPALENDGNGDGIARRQTFSVRIVESRPIDFISEVAPLGSVQIGAGLRSLCSSRTVTNGSTDTIYASNFSLNTTAGLKSPTAGAGSGFGSSGAFGAFASGFASGAGANQAQDGVLRRERGLASLIERLRRRAEEWRASRPVQYASLNEDVPNNTRNHTVLVDVAGGIVNVDRAVTPLEGGFSGDSAVANLGAAIAFKDALGDDDALLLGGTLGFERTDTTGFGGPNGRSRSEGDTTSAALFVGWTTPPVSLFGEPATATFTLTGAYSNGDLSYAREFGVAFAGQPTVLDELSGDAEQTSTTLAFHMQFSQPIGDWTVTPRASVTYVEYETDGYSETVTDASNNGLALRYANVEDEWIESRLGLAVLYAKPLREDVVLDIGVGADAIFVGDAETPLRTAYFAQDLRATPFPVVYNVDDLDEQYYDLSLSVGLAFANGFSPYVTAFTRQEHEYIESDGLIAGVRYAF